MDTEKLLIISRDGTAKVHRTDFDITIMCESKKDQDDCMRLLEKLDERDVEYSGDGFADGQIVMDWAKCPTCGFDIENGDQCWQQPYCCNCGQKLNWFPFKGEEKTDGQD